MAAAHAAGSRSSSSQALSSSSLEQTTDPRKAGIHAETCRSRRRSPHAISCSGESFASSTVARSSSTFMLLEARALLVGSTWDVDDHYSNGPNIILLSPYRASEQKRLPCLP